MMHPSILRSTRGFTLIELMVVITIIAILSVGSYIPYNYYSQLSQVRLSGEIIGQSVNNAKILSMNGYTFPGTSTNADIGLILRKNAGKIDLYAFQSGSVAFTEWSGAKLIRTIPLENRVQIADIPSDPFLIRLSAPSWVIKFYKSDMSELSDSGITITIGWKWVTTGALSQQEVIAKNY